MSETIEMALNTLKTIEERRFLYDSTNKVIKNLNPDFPSVVTMIDVEVERCMVKTLDAILGDEMATYYLYEIPSMKGGGFIRESDGTEWPIRSIEDVRAYVAHTHS